MTEFGDLTQRLRAFTDEREWGQFHDPKNLSMLLASEAGELLAEFRWVSSVDADAYAITAANRERIAREIGDVGIALLLLCARMDLSLDELVERKMAENAVNYPASTSKGKPERTLL